jgi:hypothetical protein
MTSNFKPGTCSNTCQPEVQRMLTTCLNKKIPNIPPGNPLAGQIFARNRASLIAKGMTQAGCPVTLPAKPTVPTPVPTPKATAKFYKYTVQHATRASCPMENDAGSHSNILSQSQAQQLCDYNPRCKSFVFSGHTGRQNNGGGDTFPEMMWMCNALPTSQKTFKTTDPGWMVAVKIMPEVPSSAPTPAPTPTPAPPTPSPTASPTMPTPAPAPTTAPTPAPTPDPTVRHVMGSELVLQTSLATFNTDREREFKTALQRALGVPADIAQVHLLGTTAESASSVRVKFRVDTTIPKGKLKSHGPSSPRFAHAVAKQLETYNMFIAGVPSIAPPSPAPTPAPTQVQQMSMNLMVMVVAASMLLVFTVFFIIQSRSSSGDSQAGVPMSPAGRSAVQPVSFQRAAATPQYQRIASEQAPKSNNAYNQMSMQTQLPAGEVPDYSGGASSKAIASAYDNADDDDEF